MALRGRKEKWKLWRYSRARAAEEARQANSWSLEVAWFMLSTCG